MLVASCGGSSNAGGCPKSSKEEPLSNQTAVSCTNWELRIETATVVPNDVILQANMFNDVSDFKSWFVIEATLLYDGPETGRISQVISNSSKLVGRKNLIYTANWEKPTFSELKDMFAPIPFDASQPYSGGSVTVSMWFWVDSDDLDFMLGLVVSDPEADEPNVWIDVSTDTNVEEQSQALPEQQQSDTPRRACEFTESSRNFDNCEFASPLNLEGLNLANVSMVGANLLGANLNEVNLTGANLTGANLTGAKMYSVNLTGANLPYANLTGANLPYANLNEVNLTGANLTGANLMDANLTGANLTGANLLGVNLGGVNLTDANLTSASLINANMPYTNQTRALLVDANLTGALFSDANLTGANLTGANLTDVEDLKYANLTGANLEGVIGYNP